MSLFSTENINKWAWGLISALSIMVVMGLITAFTDSKDALKKGKEAYDKINIINPKFDSLCFRVQKSEQKLDVFLSIQRVRDSVMIEAVKEIKQDIKTIKK